MLHLCVLDWTLIYYVCSVLRIMEPAVWEGQWPGHTAQFALAGLCLLPCSRHQTIWLCLCGNRREEHGPAFHALNRDLQDSLIFKMLWLKQTEMCCQYIVSPELSSTTVIKVIFTEECSKSSEWGRFQGCAPANKVPALPGSTSLLEGLFTAMWPSCRMKERCGLGYIRSHSRLGSTHTRALYLAGFGTSAALHCHQWVTWIYQTLLA